MTEFHNKLVQRLYENDRLERHIEICYCPRLEQECLRTKVNQEHLHNSHANEGPVSEIRMKIEDSEDVELFKKITNP